MHLELLPGPLHFQKEALQEHLPETPLRSCVILRKPQTLSFPTVKQIIISSLFPSPGYEERLIKPALFTSEPQGTQVLESEAQCAPCLDRTADNRFDIQQHPASGGPDSEEERFQEQGALILLSSTVNGACSMLASFWTLGMQREETQPCP